MSVVDRTAIGSAPLVSILIPCYNARQWIAQAVESALAQTWPNKEVIVVDDGSTDCSLEVIRTFGDRIRWETGPNHGLEVTRNRLLALAKGDWLQCLDADDYLLPDKIADQISGVALEEADVICGPWYLEFYEQGRAVKREVLTVPALNENDPWFLLIRWMMPGTHAGLLRRSAIQDVGGWKLDQPACEDYALYVRLLMAGKRFVYTPATGAVYRHWSNTTRHRKNPLVTLLARVEVINHAADHLSATGQMTPSHQDAIAHARLECARGIYVYDRTLARQVARLAVSRHRGFRLPAASCFPAGYRLAYQLLGFSGAECVARLSRCLRAVPTAARS
jgi:glycosyltransferase involved in cell wall biosynthesis